MLDAASLAMLIVLSVTVYYQIELLNASNSVVVDSPFGKIQGARKIDGNTGLSYLSFYGIPYAKPPLGDLRFAKPEPHPKLEGVFDATKDDQIVCPHPDELTLGMTNFTEDCLVLNIQMKEKINQTDSLKNVIVYIHGGGYHFGTGIIHEGKSFVVSQDDVVVVTINYRLGVLGFLSMENEASPGNYGLWDQTLAIKWVKDNIRAFGGDPDDITIAGESAGGSAVGFQTITPHAKGLFTKAYALSGTASSVFTQSINAQSHALDFARSVGCWEGDIYSKIDLSQSEKVIECLKKVSIPEITAFMPYDDRKTQFVPLVDGDFVPDVPAKLLTDDEYLDSVGFFDRSYMISIVNNEVGVYDNLMSWTRTAIFANDSLSHEEKAATFRRFEMAVKDLHIVVRLGETAARNSHIVDQIDKFYENKYPKESIVSELSNNLNNIIASYDFLIAASRRESTSAYFLYFNHFPRFVTGPKKGTPHEADLTFWFDLDLQYVEDYVNAGIRPELFDDNDKEIKRMFSSIIGEFARSG